MNKKDVEKIRERISELTRKWEGNQVKIMQIQQDIKRQLEVDQSLRGGISELERILRSHVPDEEKIEEAPVEKEE